MTVLSKSTYKLSSFIVFLFLATSGFPSFLVFRKLLPILLPIILYYLLKSSNKTSISNIWKLLIVFGIFSLLHYLLGHFSIQGAISFVLIMATIFSFAVLAHDSFASIYVRVIKFLCYISLVIWSLIVLIPSFHSILMSIGNNLPQFFTNEWLENTSNPGVSLYLYYLPESTTSLYTDFIRNSGPFYEPGLFASYIIIALIINVSALKKLFHRKNLILILGLLSTCSSAGYISFALLILYSISFQKGIIKKLLSLIVLAALFQPVMELDFMADKVASNMQNADQSAASRFGAIAYHMEKIAESPLVGYAGGVLPQTEIDRYLGGFVENRLSPNGLSYAFVYWGIPFALILYFMLYKGMKLIIPYKIRTWEYIFLYVILLSTAFSQTITTEPILLLIALLPIAYERSCTTS